MEENALEIRNVVRQDKALRLGTRTYTTVSEICELAKEIISKANDKEEKVQFASDVAAIISNFQSRHDEAASDFYDFLNQQELLEEARKKEVLAVDELKESKIRAEKNRKHADKGYCKATEKWGQETTDQVLSIVGKSYQTLVAVGGLASGTGDWRTAAAYLARAQVDRLHNIGRRGIPTEKSLQPTDVRKARDILRKALGGEGPIPRKPTNEELREVGMRVGENNLLEEITGEEEGHQI